MFYWCVCAGKVCLEVQWAVENVRPHLSSTDWALCVPTPRRMYSIGTGKVCVYVMLDISNMHVMKMQ